MGDGGWETGDRWEKNRILLDPYAPLVSAREKFGVRDNRERFEHQVGQNTRPGTDELTFLWVRQVGSQFLGTFDFEAEPYDWGDDDKRQRIDQKDLIIYEMPVRTFTADPSSALDEEERGTFQGITKKVCLSHGLLCLTHPTNALLTDSPFGQSGYQCCGTASCL